MAKSTRTEPGGLARAWPLWVAVAGLLLTAVSRLPVWSGGGDTIVHPGVGLDAVGELGGVVGLLGVALACLAGAVRARRSRGSVAALVAVLVLGALGALLLAGLLAMMAALSRPMHRQYARFDAPDGTAYLLYAEDDESGMIAVYDGGPVQWHAVPSVDGDGRAFVLPGEIPCAGRATDTQIVVSCEGGPRALTYPR